MGLGCSGTLPTALFFAWPDIRFPGSARPILTRDNMKLRHPSHAPILKANNIIQVAFLYTSGSDENNESC